MHPSGYTRDAIKAQWETGLADLFFTSKVETEACMQNVAQTLQHV